MSSSAPDTFSISNAKSKSSNIKDIITTGVHDFRIVFLYPLCTGIMTGVGFILGKRIGEKYFYGGVGKSP